MNNSKYVPDLIKPKEDDFYDIHEFNENATDIEKAFTAMVGLYNTVEEKIETVKTDLEKKQDADITLEDSGGSKTLPPTQKGSVTSKIQALRNNVKELFSYFAEGITNIAAKLATARSINGMSFDGSSDVGNFAVCSSSANAEEKIVTIPNLVRKHGAEITVYFEYGNTNLSPMLKVNGESAFMWAKNDIIGENEQLLKPGGTYTFRWKADGHASTYRWHLVGANFGEQSISNSGAFTPELTLGDESNVEVTQIPLSAASGLYRREGNLVHFWLRIVVGSNLPSVSGYMRIENIPFVNLRAKIFEKNNNNSQGSRFPDSALYWRLKNSSFVVADGRQTGTLSYIFSSSDLTAGMCMELSGIYEIGGLL